MYRWRFMAATNCVDTMLFGQVCDACDGGAIFKIVSFGVKIVSAGVLVLAVIGIIICGVMILSAGSSPDRVAKGKKRLIEVIIGIIVYALMFTIANFIIPGGVITSTLDSSTSSCPETPKIKGSDPKDPEGGGDQDPEGGAEAGKYPHARLEGEPITGYITCPRNADYKYQYENVLWKNIKEYEKLDEYFQSQAHSCPFTEVKYTQTEKDKACSPDGKLHYAQYNGNEFCIVNSKIDLFEYKKYLDDNHIAQDGKTCSASASGEDCKWGSSKPYEAYNDYGACYYFSITFASNLNYGEVVSNDAYTAQAGYPNYHAHNGRTRYGNDKVNWYTHPELVRYGDHLTSIWVKEGDKMDTVPHDSGLTGGLAQLKQGKAVGHGVHKPRVGTGNCGHYLTAVGFSYSCTKPGASCPASSWVVLNTNGKIGTLAGTGYVDGYKRACDGT